MYYCWQGDRHRGESGSEIVWDSLEVQMKGDNGGFTRPILIFMFRWTPCTSSPEFLL